MHLETTGRRTRRGAPSVLAVLSGLTVLALLLSGCSLGDPGTVTSTALGSPTPASTPGTSSGAASAPGTSSGSVGTSPAGPAPATADHSGAGVYAAAGPNMLSAAAQLATPAVYVPNTLANTVSVIDPATFKVIRTLKVSGLPQHVVPAWDLSKLWVNDNNGNNLVPINPQTGQRGNSVPVEDPYNLYFSPDGRHAMVMAERLQRIDFRDAHTMRFQRSLHVPCHGVNHADFTADLTSFVVSCEFSGKLLVIPADGARVTKVIDLNSVATPGATDPMQAMRHGGPAAGLQPGASSMPQDVRLSPDGRTFLAADMLRNGVWLIDAATFTVRGFLPTGLGAHGINPSRDEKSIYVSNRDEGTVSVLDAATLKVTALWRIPGGGSPDMGGVSADGRQLWLSGRSNGVVYVFDTVAGKLIHKIRVGAGPHGLCVWPQPGRFSLGHTGNMR